MSRALPAGVWDNPESQDRAVWEAFVEAWYEEIDEPIFSALAYAYDGDSDCEVIRGETRSHHSANTDSVSLSGIAGEFADGEMMVICLSCTGQSATGFSPDNGDWTSLSSPLDIDSITTQAFWRRADGSAFTDTFSADGTKSHISYVVVSYAGIDSIKTTQTLSETGVSGAEDITIGPLAEYDDWHPAQVVLFGALSGVAAQTWDGTTNYGHDFVAMSNNGSDSDVVCFEEYLEPSIDATTGEVDNSTNEDVTLGLTGNNGTDTPYSNGYYLILSKNDCVCQYGVPDGDLGTFVPNDGTNWTREDGSSSNFYQSVDNTDIDDSTYIRIPANSGSSTLDVSISDVEKSSNVGWSYHFRAKLSDDGTRGVRVDLMEDGTNTLVSGSSGYFDGLTTEWKEFAWELSEAEADNITDGSNLSFRIDAVNGGAVDVLLSRLYLIGPCFEIIAEGGVETGGVADVSKVLTDRGAGGAVLGGTSTSAKVVVVSSEGGAVISPESELWTQITEEASGGVLIVQPEHSTGFTHRVRLTIPAASLEASLMMMVGVRVPAVFEDCAVTTSAGSVLNSEIREITANDTCLFFRADLSHTTDNEFLIYFNMEDT